MYNQNKTLRRILYVFGVSMAFLMGASLIFPAFTQPQFIEDPASQPTSTPPPPTFPPPITDFSAIQLAEDYLHPSGMFSVRVPTGWEVTTTVNDTARAQVNMVNDSAVSRIQIGFENPSQTLQTVQDLNSYFDNARIQQIWVTDYANWTELGRPSTADRLIVNFRLRDRQGRNFLAQHVAYVEDDLVRYARVIMPENAQDALFYLAEVMPDAFTFYERFIEGPFGWNASFDRVHQWVLRHPRTWQRTDGGDGLPTSFRGDDGTAVRVEVVTDSSIADEDAARELVASRFSNAEIVSVAEIERPGGSGFSVAYSDRNFDGEPISGAVVLLNGENGSLYIASAAIPQGGVDVNDDSAPAAIRSVLESFSLLTSLNLPASAPQATPTPFPVQATEEPEAVETEADDVDDEEAADEDEEESADEEADDEAETDDDEADE